MAHLFYEEMNAMHRGPRLSRAAILKSTSVPDRGRQEADRQFRAFLGQNLDAKFWATHWRKDWNFRRVDNDIIVKILRGLAGVREEKIVTSHPSQGAVEGFKDRTVLEYSQVLKKGRLRPYGRLALPDAFHGLISSLATHQTLLGDAIGTEDPKTLYHALFAYPIGQNTKAARALYRDLLEINRDEIPRSFQGARDLF
jgi:alpha-galactosidase/6-phospho-beta-glucosidase family protein